jgi:hypothetical protein
MPKKTPKIRLVGGAPNSQVLGSSKSFFLSPKWALRLTFCYFLEPLRLHLGRLVCRGVQGAQCAMRT